MRYFSRTALALLVSGVLALPAMAQTTGTATTGTATTGTAATGAATTSSTTSTGTDTGFTDTGFQATYTTGFSGGAGATTATNTTAGAGKASGTALSPATTNPWLGTFGNAYGLGQKLIGATGSTTTVAKSGFGQAVLYTASTTATMNKTGGAQTNRNTNTANAFSNSNLIRTPAYTTNLGESLPYVSHQPALVQPKLQNYFANSTYFKNKDGIRVDVSDSGVVVLTGQVASERERLQAAMQVGLTPGVIQIDNRLVYPGMP